ncbi:heavy metal translocating P-type ATPase [Fischerella thermalis]|uniref:Copper-exporting P-type ATPase n=1 Tax=Fischerella thermalis CCMEE 5318 TaxID=2019666 RepID=A0A2N6LPC9_9CYAN|nr:heavy metal translocating P-type ATPase [Fischerella thermalis]PMB27567.1 cadmium-transporting ATPase [Fischerella thermalis CCMEE 5318]
MVNQDLDCVKSLQAKIGGMDCGGCAKTIEVGLQQLHGVTEASVNFATEKVRVSYDPQLISEAEILNRITALGYTVDVARVKILQVKIGGMDCGGCAKTIEVGVQQLAGVSEASVSFASERLQISYDPQLVNETTIYDWIKNLGYTVEESVEASSYHHTDCCDHDHEHHHHRRPVTRSSTYQNGDNVLNKPNQKSDPTSWKFWITNHRGQSVILAGIGVALGLLAQYLASPLWPAFYCLGIAVAGYPIARAGLFELRLRRADMNLLMTISVVGAVALGDWFEGALTVFLFSLGTTLQIFTFGRTRNAIRALMDLTPPTATVKRNGQEVTVPVKSVQVGETLTIRPGQRIPLDGVVVSGSSAIDQSPITGESIPEDKAPDDTVFAGTLNQTGFLEIKVTHTVDDTTVAKIIHLVEQAQESRAPTQQWVDKFAAIYTPIVIISAMVIALIPPLAFAQPFNVWFHRSLVLLVIACPCALVISTPVSIVSAIGAASRQGVLFKGGNALETAGRLTILAFDKTGTITQGQPVVQKIFDFGSGLVLPIAASLEQKSEHPLAKAIVAKAIEQKIELKTPINFAVLPGKGVQGSLGEQMYFVGNQRLFADQQISLSVQAEFLLSHIERMGLTPVLVGCDHGLLGVIALADGLRLEAKEAVRQFKNLGVKRLMMLTGDRSTVAMTIAQEVGITDFRAQLLPQDKLQVIQRLRQVGVVGMVGDGINDAPALAAADISFAVGGIDIALETADVVLVGNDLTKLGVAVDLSRRTVSIIRQNVIFSLVTKALFLWLGTFGFVGLAIAILADTGTSLLVTLNGMRLFRIDGHQKKINFSKK